MKISLDTQRTFVSSLLQLKNLLIITLIFQISLVSSLNIGITPAKIEFNISKDETQCQKITLFTDEKVVFIGEDKWTAKKDSKDIREYTLNVKESEIEIKYPKSMILSEKEKFDICVTAKKSKTLQGVLVYKTEKGAGVGTWIKINGKNEIPAKQILFSSSLILMLILGFMIKRLKSKNNKVI